jgi:hypothetical protein
VRLKSARIVWVTVLFGVVFDVVVDPPAVVVPVVVVLGCVIETVVIPFSTVAVTSAPLAPRTSTVATAPPFA